MSSPNTDTSAEQDSGGLNRRRVLKVLGGGSLAVPLLSGVASAHQNAFYGCSQVCSDSRGNEAVVKTDTGYECREMNETSNRQNQRWKYDSHCYEAEDGEAIVGMLIDQGNDVCSFCVNPNNCASNYYDSVEDIIDELSCDFCDEVNTTGECDVSGTGGGNGGRKPEKNGRNEGRGRKNGRNEGRGRKNGQQKRRGRKNGRPKRRGRKKGNAKHGRR